MKRYEKSLEFELILRRHRLVGYGRWSRTRGGSTWRFDLDVIINTLWYCIGLQLDQWKVVFHYHSAVRQANCPRKGNSQACFKTLESLAYDFYDGSFKTDCVFLVQSFTFYQELMVSGSEHLTRRVEVLNKKFFTESLSSGIPEVRALTYLYTVF